MKALLFASILVSLYFLSSEACLASCLLFLCCVARENGTKGLVKSATLSFVLLLATGLVLTVSTPSCGLAEENVDAVYGRVGQDSLVSKFSQRRVTLSLEECYAKGPDAASARGLVNVSYPDGERFYAGDMVIFHGKFNEYGFSAKDYRLVSHGLATRTRGRLLERIESSLLEEEGAQAELSLMLLLGYSDSGSHPLSILARESGTSHVLALSGMHLSLFSLLLKAILTPLFGKRNGRFISLLFIAFYVVLIGPKASILRAFMLSIVIFMSNGKITGVRALFVTFLAQCLLFPDTVTSLACTYSYLSLIGIMTLSQSIQNAIDDLVLLPSFIVSSLSASAAAILYSAPLSWLVFGSYQLSALITGAPVSALIYIYMLVSIFPFASFLKPYVYSAIEALMRFGSSFGKCTSPMGFLILLFLVLLLLLLSAKLAACGQSTMKAAVK